MKNFFCSKDCPDLCGVRVESAGGKYSFSGVPEKWSEPGFVCAKFKLFAKREIDNGLQSWQLEGGKRNSFASDADALRALADFLESYRDKKILFSRGSGSLAYNMVCWDILFSGFENCWGVAGDPCMATGCDADEMDFGILANPEITDLEHADTIFLFGKNAAATSQHLYAYLKKLKKKGKKIVYIDPIRTKTAELADRYIMIRPGCDGVLACAALTALQYENEHETGVLLERAGVSEDDFNYLLACLQNGRTAIIKGCSSQRYDNGLNVYRWLNRLAVKTGNVELLYFTHPSKRYWEKPGISFQNKIRLDQIPQALADGEFDLFVNVAANPAMTHPDGNTWETGLQRTKVLVIDTNDSKTASHADFFLKVGGMFSQSDFMGSYFFSHRYSREGLTEELSDVAASKILADKLGLAMQLKEEKDLERLQGQQREYKASALSLTMPEVSEKFQLLTLSHEKYLNSQILPGMEQGLQVIHINSSDAKRLGISTGEDVKVSGSVGAFVAEALVTDKVVAGTVMCWKNIPMKESICNCAIPSKVTDSGSGLSYYTTFVDLRKC